jgi:hypothetical protein
MSNDELVSKVRNAFARIFARADGPTAAMRAYPSVWSDGNDEIVCVTMSVREAEGFALTCNADNLERERTRTAPAGLPVDPEADALAAKALNARAKEPRKLAAGLTQEERDAVEPFVVEARERIAYAKVYDVYGHRIAPDAIRRWEIVTDLLDRLASTAPAPAGGPRPSAWVLRERTDAWVEEQARKLVATISDGEDEWEGLDADEQNAVMETVNNIYNSLAVQAERPAPASGGAPEPTRVALATVEDLATDLRRRTGWPHATCEATVIRIMRAACPSGLTLVAGSPIATPATAEREG